jgi:FkbM family methyltransferase
MKGLRLVEDLLVRMGTIVIPFLPKRLWLRIREETAIVKRMDYERYPIHMCVDSWIENEVRLHSCNKEPGTIQWIENCFNPGDVFYDIGANAGAYSLIGFRFLKGKTKIYAFEPGFVTFPQLCRNIYLNNAGEAIVPLQVALSEETSLSAFHYQNLVPSGALHALGAPIDYRGRGFQPVLTLPILSYRLDDLVREFGLRIPNHIKIDVDGVECQILKGSEKILSSPELRSILVEINEERGDADEIKRLLNEKGFVLDSQQNDQSVYYRKSV